MKFSKEKHHMDPGLPGGQGRREVAQAVKRRGKWHRPDNEQPPEPDDKTLNPESERSLVGFSVGATGYILEKTFVPQEGINHDTWITPYAPYLVPFLFGISLAQADAAMEMVEKNKPFSGSVSSIMSFCMVWEAFTTARDAIYQPNAATLVPALLFAGGALIGRGLKEKNTKKTQ